MSKLWTVTGDSFATGEGRQLYGLITYAENETEALRKFSEEYGSRLGSLGKAKEGVSDVAPANAIFSEFTLAYCKKLEGQAMLKMTGTIYFNLS